MISQFHPPPPAKSSTQVSSYKLIIEVCGTFLWKIYAGRHIDYLCLKVVMYNIKLSLSCQLKLRA
jgi:hypothetical protein